MAKLKREEEDRAEDDEAGKSKSSSIFDRHKPQPSKRVVSEKQRRLSRPPPAPFLPLETTVGACWLCVG